MEPKLPVLLRPVLGSQPWLTESGLVFSECEHKDQTPLIQTSRASGACSASGGDKQQETEAVREVG